MTCRRTTHGVVHNKTAQVIALEPYAKVLARTQGRMPEFVNPKYDSGGVERPRYACRSLPYAHARCCRYDDYSKTTFKSPTRLESMMQDHAKLVSPTSSVGFTQFSPSECVLIQLPPRLPTLQARSLTRTGARV